MRGKTARETTAAGDEIDRQLADRRLFARLRDERDPLDRDAVVERFLPLARQLAARYQRAEEPFDDVFQVACFGLVKAVDRFDADRGVAFSSYAVPTITGEIKRHFRDKAWAVRVPRDLQELALRVERVTGDLTRDLGRRPTVEEVATAIGHRGRGGARGDEASRRRTGRRRSTRRWRAVTTRPAARSATSSAWSTRASCGPSSAPSSGR